LDRKGKRRERGGLASMVLWTEFHLKKGGAKKRDRTVEKERRKKGGKGIASGSKFEIVLLGKEDDSR